MWAVGGQAEDIRSELHGGIALASAAGHAQFADGDMAAFGGAFGTFTQGVSQPFKDGPVKVGTRMHIAEANHSAFGFRSR